MVYSKLAIALILTLASCFSQSNINGLIRDIQPLTAPVGASFTAINFNTGAGVVTTQISNSSPFPSITLIQHDPNATGNLAALDKTIIASTFTVSAAIATQNASTGTILGLVLTDGTKFIFFGNIPGAANAAVISMTTVSANYSVVYDNAGPAQTSAFNNYQITETVATRTYRGSPDGINWIQLYTEPVGTFLTTSRYGFGLSSNKSSSTASPDQAVTVYSFVEPIHEL